MVSTILGSLALLSLALTLWQWVVARRFPLHERTAGPTKDATKASFESQPAPAVTLLKSLKGCDDSTEACLRSWFVQDYEGPVQILFGVASAEDASCEVVRRLQAEFPARDTQLVVCGPLLGANAKVAKLVRLESLAKHEVLVISDADVRVPPDLLADVVGRLQEAGVGLVNCFYCLANPSTVAMQWEAIAINADFWSSVLQAQSLKPIDFALGAAMATRRRLVNEVGGFAGLADCLADDYQLGHRIAGRGYRIAISPVVVECWAEPMGWAAVWKHQLRWARTIRVCQPAPYFFSILNNGTLWPLAWVAAKPCWPVLTLAGCCWLVRMWTARDLQGQLTRRRAPLRYAWLVPGKDLLQTAVWMLAFLGNRIEWRGRKMQLRRDGTLAEVSKGVLAKAGTGLGPGEG